MLSKAKDLHRQLMLLHHLNLKPDSCEALGLSFPLPGMTSRRRVFGIRPFVDKQKHKQGTEFKISLICLFQDTQLPS